MVLWLYVLYTTVQSYRFASLDDCQRLFLAVFAAKLLNDALTCLCLSIPGVVAMSFMCKTLSTYIPLKNYPPRTDVRVLHTNENLIYHMICLCRMGGTKPRLCIHSTLCLVVIPLQVWDSHSFYVRMVDTIDITTCTCEHRKSGISFVYTRSSTIMDSICWL